MTKDRDKPPSINIMSYELTKELSDIETQIRDAILSGDNFRYQKLLRMKSENLDSQFFAETKNLRSEIESLTESRAAAVSERESLTADLKAAADEVFSARSIVYDLEENHSRIANSIYFLDQKAEIDRQTIKDLSKRLETHINTKLNTESGDN